MKSCDVCVVGAGPAGIGAALAAAQAGASVCLIDEQPRPGGRLRERVAPVSDVTANDGSMLPAIRLAERLAERIDASTVEFVSGVVWGLFEDNVAGVLAGDACFQLRAGSVVVATGSTDAVRPFPGWTLPGVVTGQQLQRLMHLERVLPGNRFAIIGTGEMADEVAHDIEAAGGQVVARPPNAAAIEASGYGKLEQIRVEGAAYAVDTVVIALGRQPDAALALQARVSLRYDEASRAQVPAVDESGRTSNASLFLAGDAVGVVSEPIAYAQGWLAGLTAAGAAAEAVKAARRNLLEAESAAADRTAGEIHFSLADLSDDVPVCRCEQVDAASVRQAIREGALTLNDVKRRTRCGMGLCQGIFCLGTVAQMIHQHAGVPYEQLEPMTSRPPARAIPLEALAAMSEDEIPIEEVEGRAG